jgi:hypothetical protein
VWYSGLPEEDTLHLHVVPLHGACQVIMGRGHSPAWPQDEYVDYLIVRRNVANGSVSHFLTVLDAFQSTPTVESVRVVSEEPIVLEVQRANGVDTITIHIPNGPSRTTAHRPLGVDVRSAARNVRIGNLGDGTGPGYAMASILDVDYEHETVFVEQSEGWQQDFAPGRTVRVHNEMRSQLLTIAQADRNGERVRLTFGKTALMARLPVLAVRGNRLELGVKTPFTTGHVNEDTGELTDGPNDYYYGCWIGEGTSARKVGGISNTSPPRLYLHGNHEATALAHDYAGKVVNVWLYGVGDTIEAARIHP